MVDSKDPTDEAKEEVLKDTDPVDFNRGVSQAIFDAIRTLFEGQQRAQGLLQDLAAAFMTLEKGKGEMYDLLMKHDAQLKALENKTSTKNEK